MYRTQHHALRVCKVDGPPGYTDGGEFTVLLYRCGIFWMSEAYTTEQATLQGAVFYVDVVTSGGRDMDGLDWIPMFQNVIDEEGSSAFALTFSTPVM